MKISIALATFNGEKFIIEQLESINKQSQQSNEVVISDDNSTNETKEIVEEYINDHNLSHWILIDNELGKGVSNNFINALRHTSGDIVFLCDQDDIWEFDKVETMVAAFDNKVECVISAIKYINQEGKPIIDKTAYTNKKDHVVNMSELCGVCSYLGMSSAYRRNTVDDTENSFMKETAHDWALMIKASEKGIIKYIGKPVQRYRQHLNNASVIKNGTRKKNRLDFIRRQINILSNTKKYTKENNRRKILETYVRFNKKRIEWISGKMVSSILLNIPRYRQLKFTFRNVVADIVATL